LTPRNDPARAAERPKVGLIALGCPKALVDSEMMLGRLAEGADIAGRVEDADVVVVNTCAFVEAAKRESIETILEVAERKRRGELRRVIVTGCLAQRYPEELRKEIPDLDAIVGLTAEGELPRVLSELERKKTGARLKKLPMAGESGAGKPPLPRVIVRDPSKPFEESSWGIVKRGNARAFFGPTEDPIEGAEVGRLRLTPRHYAYLRVAEGCDHACTFCAIPGFRGRFRSKPERAVIAEARELARDGAKELILIAEDTNQYGQDRRDGSSLATLLPRLAAIEGVEWIRILYAYPAYFSPELIRAIREIEKVVKYLDMPLQHISDSVLRRMRRPTKQQTVDLIARLRDEIPGLAIRTTFICGFPGETERDHEELLDFVRKTRFERVGAFAYSEEDGTLAARFEGKVPPAVRERRREALMAAQQPIAFHKGREKVGRRLRVLVDHVEAEGRAIARSEHDAPEIDGVVRVFARGRRFSPGEMIDVVIVRADGYDLEAAPAQ
jgi:ribosomal protein S12 methylthiotransferase